MTPYEIELDPEEPVEHMKELANDWIFVTEPRFHAPLRIDYRGHLKLLPSF